MRLAAFREHPHASYVAEILADQGYDTELVQLDNNEHDSRARDLSEAICEAAWASAFLLTNCELDHFERLVTENYGECITTYRRRMRMAC